jgi:cytochrome c oxidase subunit 2
MQSADVIQSVVAPAGTQSLSIHHLWQLMLWVSVAVFFLTMAFVWMGLVRGRRRAARNEPIADAQQTLTRGVAGAVAATALILFAILIASVWTGRTVASLHASSAVTINIVGHQWWWEIAYEDALPARRVQTANEIHIPTDRPVVLKVTSRDVIHSFWAPNLQGKRDLIPGYTTAIWLQADRPGVFRGQCAEFCGLQHAHMAFDVVAEPEAEFERWLERMRQPAREPLSEDAQRGRDVFMATKCAGCHTVNGTSAHGQAAPDLTHVSSRPTIAAGTLPNTPEHMRTWVSDPQSSKPGNQMPPNPLSPEDLSAVLVYLGTLR